MNNEIGERIKDARKNAGLTQEALGKMVDISPMSIRRYESGERSPKMATLHKIADALNIDINYLLNGKTLEQRDQELINKLQDRVEWAYNMGARIKQTREKCKVDMRAAAFKTGIPLSTFRRYENGMEMPKLKDIQKIALAFNVSFGELLGYPNDELAELIAMAHPDDMVIIDDYGKPAFYSEDLFERQKQLNAIFRELNESGQKTAIERVRELSEIARYVEPHGKETGESDGSEEEQS